MSSEVGDGAARQATGRHQRPASISRHGTYVHKSEYRNKSPFAGETQVTCINTNCTGAASGRYQCNSNRVVDFGAAPWMMLSELLHNWSSGWVAYSLGSHH
ncbi:uncharacterized protein TrAFT101_011300 [Trichoderma asperellum]|uniref:uncharacterized protein n=1 Tax=Trichoderma asperellum TaxID=101201 RepID=UPI0033305344|nr:hypothetical protein TrAFT101_011300 [Trichoderma asperellum]